MTLYDPRSVAVVGASDNPSKWGYWLASGALAGSHRRAVHLVNRRGGEILGRLAYRSLAELPEPPELVVVSVPSGQFRNVVEDGIAAGARYFVGVTASVAEEAELAALVRAAGARLLGPNCMGLVDTAAELSVLWGRFPAGAVGMLSQSGNLGLEVGRLLERSGRGFSRFVSVGNQADLDLVELLDDLVEHEPTRVIAVYAEQLRDGRRFVETAARARAAGKPVILLTVGGEASRRVAASHTGALVADAAVVDAACRAAGALRVHTPGELADAIAVLTAAVRPRGRRVLVAGDSGGQCAVAADALDRAGLHQPVPPSDLAGAGEADLASYAEMVAELAAAGTDSVLLTGYFGEYATDLPHLADTETEVARRMAKAASEAGTALVVHTMAADTPAVRAMRAEGVPVFERVEQATAALGAAVAWHVSTVDLPLAAVGGSPTVGPGVSGSTAAVDGSPTVGPGVSGDMPVVPSARRCDIRRLLGGYGVPFPTVREVTDLAGALAAATEIGYPVVLKATGLAHKTEAGGVALRLRDPHQLARSYVDMSTRLAARSYTVEPMVERPDSVELIVGARRDPAFGPTVLVGLGGVLAELLADTALALAPVTAATARTLLASLRGADLLTGWRGAPAIDLDAVAGAVAAVSRCAAEHPELAEIEVNPLLAWPGGVLALDVLSVPAGP